jgi:hypothetical protein
LVGVWFARNNMIPATEAAGLGNRDSMCYLRVGCVESAAAVWQFGWVVVNSIEKLMRAGRQAPTLLSSSALAMPAKRMASTLENPTYVTTEYCPFVRETLTLKNVMDSMIADLGKIAGTPRNSDRCPSSVRVRHRARRPRMPMRMTIVRFRATDMTVINYINGL